MKIELPHRVLHIKEEQKSMSDSDKLNFVNSILNETVTIRGVEMTLEYYLAVNNNATTSFIKEQLAYFLVKEHKVKQDIITKEEMKRMRKGSGHSIPFTSVSYKNGVKIGLIDRVEDNN